MLVRAHKDELLSWCLYKVEWSRESARMAVKIEHFSRKAHGRTSVITFGPDSIVQQLNYQFKYKTFTAPQLGRLQSQATSYLDCTRGVWSLHEKFFRAQFSSDR